MERLVDRLRENVSWEAAEEVTFECEPGTLSEAKVKTLREIGVTRLSLGVEHFDDEILRDNGRASRHIAYRGVFQLMLTTAKVAQLLRLTVARDLACVPEISANK